MDPARPGRPPTVLVVDDDVDLLDLTVRTLARAGWTVLRADGGDTALELAGEVEVDVVLTDVVMPGTDGLALVEVLRRARPALPVVFTTGHDDPAIHAAVAATGAPLVPKPYTPATLRTVLHEALAGDDGEVAG
ncbi:response regulator [Iamia majanohamensis]|uniref:Response regulator n=1 Tax=Iamia majanohamensis TaxID=467976 RepID=A0AAE9Y7T3_9ACTN|nr:response regulator [Iamia majanohamensis]WCO66018.1 response regulator [Iamia majanohamensis]